MSNKNKALLPIIGVLFFALSLYGVYLGYNYLSARYIKNNDNITIQEENTSNSIENKKVLAKDFVVYGDNLKAIKLSDYLGTPVVINYWASWCPPCKAEMPAFNEMTAKYKDAKIAILMINATDGQRETMSIAKKYIDQNNFDMKVLYDSKMDLANKYNISSIPRTIFIDKDGYIVEDHTGTMSKELLESNIKFLLAD